MPLTEKIDIIMIFNVKAKKESYLDVSSSRNGCLFSKYCTGSFGRSHLSPGKEEPGQHMRTDINTSLELYISRGSSDGKLGIMPRKELPHRALPFGISPDCAPCIRQQDQKPSLVYSESSLPLADSAIPHAFRVDPCCLAFL